MSGYTLLLCITLLVCLSQLTHAAPQYSWGFHTIGYCSVPCGNGIQEREVYCLDDLKHIVDDTFCPSATKPASTQQCYITGCFSKTYTWQHTAYGTCSKLCGTGTRTRTVTCIDSDNQSSNIANCNEADRPAATENCNTHACPASNIFHWQMSALTPCSALCGGGVQTRTVHCVNGLNTIVQDNLCLAALPGLKPAASFSCNTRLCLTCHWNTGTPSQCSAPCNGGIRVRTVQCLDQFATACDQCTTIQPATQLACNTQVCARVTGDPEFTGFGGQKYEVHGIPNSYFNIITSPLLQYNAKFVYLPKASSYVKQCNASRTHPWTHAGTYLGELGIKTGSDRIYMVAGTCLDGITKIMVNDEELVIGARKTLARVAGRNDLIQSIVRTDAHTVKLHLAEVTMTLVNSDMFFNQDVQLTQYATYSSTHTMHGLLGSTITNQTYTGEHGAKQVWEGLQTDYLVQEDDIFGDDFIFNRFADPNNRQ